MSSIPVPTVSTIETVLSAFPNAECSSVRRRRQVSLKSAPDAVSQKPPAAESCPVAVVGEEGSFPGSFPGGSGEQRRRSARRGGKNEGGKWEG